MAVDDLPRSSSGRSTLVTRNAPEAATAPEIIAAKGREKS
jgi:hypothetical protein